MFKVITLATILVIVAAKHCNKDGMCNVAHGGTAGQTTTGWGGTAGRAIDGRTSGKYSDRSCTHTHRQQVNKWWVELQGIALGYTYPIDSVVIYNRQDCCSSRLNGAKVIAQLGKDGETKECGTVQLENGVSRYSFNCNDFEADRVMVLLNKNFLTLCEVEVLVKQASMPESKHDNVALEGIASQSSTGWGGIASRAIDGKTSGSYRDNTCTHSRTNKNNKWSVILKGSLAGAKYPIDKVIIYNRQDCCADRLVGAKVWVDDQLCGVIEGVKRSYAIDCAGKSGGDISITLDNQHLTLCEVEVYVEKEKLPNLEDLPNLTNVALNGTATQSSEGWNGVASRAIDGNRDGNYRGNSCTHTRYNKNNKWSVTLAGGHFGAKYPVSKVVIYNRQDCCSDRLKGAKVWVGDQLCGEIMAPSSVNVIDCEGKLGGIVSVSQDTQFLTLCEVEVYVKESDIPENLPEYTNVALEGTASQSSEGWGGKAERAIDGNTSGNYNSRSCTHSRYNKNNWWKVALSSTTKIASVVIYNRQDCCQNRIDGAQVWVDGTKCGDVKYDGSSVYQIDCSGAEGESVIVKQDKNILTLCEVEVYTRTDENPSEETDE